MMTFDFMFLCVFIRTGWIVSRATHINRGPILIRLSRIYMLLSLRWRSSSGWHCTSLFIITAIISSILRQVIIKRIFLSCSLNLYFGIFSFLNIDTFNNVPYPLIISQFMHEFLSSYWKERTLRRKALDSCRIIPFIDDILLSKHLSLTKKCDFDVLELFGLINIIWLWCYFILRIDMWAIVPMRSDEIPTLFRLHGWLDVLFSHTSPYDFKFTLVDYIYSFGCVTLAINYLVSFEFFKVERVDELFDLKFGLKLHERKVAEEFYRVLDLFVFDALEYSLVVLSLYHSKWTLTQTLNPRSPWLVIDQRQLSEAATFFEPDDFCKPFIVLKALNLRSILIFLWRQFDVGQDVKSEFHIFLFELLLYAKLVGHFLAGDVVVVDAAFGHSFHSLELFAYLLVDAARRKGGLPFDVGAC